MNGEVNLFFFKLKKNISFFFFGGGGGVRLREGVRIDVNGEVKFL